MSDLLKIVSFSVFLSTLWVIPRFEVIIQWAVHHVWSATGIGSGLICCFFLIHWTKQRLIQKELKGKKTEPLN